MLKVYFITTFRGQVFIVFARTEEEAIRYIKQDGHKIISYEVTVYDQPGVIEARY